MPGFSIVSSSASLDQDRIKHALDRLLHFSNYNNRVIYKNEKACLASTGYEAYPIEIVDDGRYLVAIEGRIYNRNKETIVSDAKKIFADGAEASTLKDYDGEFLGIVLDRHQNRFCIYNDVLSRLPFYYFHEKGLFVASREIKFIRELFPELKIDRLALAEQLLFSTFLQTNTYFKGIKRLNPATILKYDENLSIQHYHEFDFDVSDGQMSRAGAVRELSKAFLEGAENRLADYQDQSVVVALSDGFDSRTVLGALTHFREDIQTITYQEHDKRRQEMVDTARRVASYHDCHWREYALRPVDRSEIEHVVTLFDATVPSIAPFSQLLPYLKVTFGEDCIFFTGDEGDLILPPVPRYGKAKACETIDELAELIVENAHANAGAVFTFSEIENLTGVSSTDVHERIVNILSSYPEMNLIDKYIHFIIREIGFNWNFVREDRYRYYFWYTSLFWSPSFFRAAMAVPAKLKMRRKVYVPFMKAIGACAEVPTDSYQFDWYSQVKRYFGQFEALKLVYKRLFGRKSSKTLQTRLDKMSQAKLEEFESLFSDQEVFNSDSMSSILEDSISKPQLERLFTTTHYLMTR